MLREASAVEIRDALAALGKAGAGIWTPSFTTTRRGLGAVGARTGVAVSDRARQLRNACRRGPRMELFKEVGTSGAGRPGMNGMHGIGHTRIAIESAVTTRDYARQFTQWKRDNAPDC